MKYILLVLFLLLVVSGRAFAQTSTICLDTKELDKPVHVKIFSLFNAIKTEKQVSVFISRPNIKVLKMGVFNTGGSFGSSTRIVLFYQIEKDKIKVKELKYNVN